jgi:hypothetical protein
MIPRLLILFVIFFVAWRFAKQNNNSTEKNGFALVELFTSEGCSSCPPAEAAVARLLNKKINNVFILSYHVDYWDRLGWKDAYSNAAYSSRQTKYASLLKLSNIYTPQIVVNGAEEFVGSNENRLNTAVENNLKKHAANDLHVSASKKENVITIKYSLPKQSVLLNLAFIQPEATTDVKRGENQGRQIHHVNIVRLLKTVEANGENTVSVKLPKELASIPLQLIAFTQDKNNYSVLSAQHLQML